MIAVEIDCGKQFEIGDQVMLIDWYNPNLHTINKVVIGTLEHKEKMSCENGLFFFREVTIDGVLYKETSDNKSSFGHDFSLFLVTEKTVENEFIHFTDTFKSKNNEREKEISKKVIKSGINGLARFNFNLFRRKKLKE